MKKEVYSHIRNVQSGKTGVKLLYIIQVKLLSVLKKGYFIYEYVSFMVTIKQEPRVAEQNIQVKQHNITEKH